MKLRIKPQYRWLVGGLAMLGMLALAAWTALPVILARQWTERVRALGFPQAELAIDHLGLSSAIGAMSLGGTDSVDRFAASFTPAGLLGGRLTSLNLTGMRISRPMGRDLVVPMVPLPVDGPISITDMTVPLALPGDVGSASATVNMALTPVQGGMQVQGDGAIRVGSITAPIDFSLSASNGRLSAAAFALKPTGGDTRLNGQGKLRRLANGNLDGEVELTASRLPDGLPDLTLRWKHGEGTGALEWRGIARLDATLVNVDGGRQRLDGRLRIDDVGGFARQLRRPDPGITGGPVVVTAAIPDISFADIPQKWPDAALRLDANGIGVGQGPRNNSLSMAATARRIEGDWWLSAGADPSMGTLIIPALSVDVRGIALSGRAAWPLNLDLRAAKISLPWLAPVSMNAKMRVLPKGDLRMEWQAVMADLNATLSGAVDVAAGGGTMTVRFPPTRLGSRDIKRLLPLSDLPSSMSGIVGARATVTWNGADIGGSADLMMEDVGVILPGFRAAGANGTLHFDQLSPLSLPPQTISIGLFDPGLALRDGGVTVGLHKDGVVTLIPSAFRWAGTAVDVSPISFRYGNNIPDVVVNVPSVPLTNVFQELGLSGINAEGAVIGTIPIRFRSTGIEWLGSLRSAAPGRLALTESTIPSWLENVGNDNLALVTQALSDYRFKALDLIMARQGLRLSVDGANPGLYGGYAMPIHLNLNLPVQNQRPALVPPDIASAISAFKARRD